MRGKIYCQIRVNQKTKTIKFQTKHYKKMHKLRAILILKKICCQMKRVLLLNRKIFGLVQERSAKISRIIRNMKQLRSKGTRIFKNWFQNINKDFLGNCWMWRLRVVHWSFWCRVIFMDAISLILEILKM